MWTILQDIWRGVVIFYGIGNLIVLIALIIKSLSEVSDLEEALAIMFFISEFAVVAYFCFSWLGWI